MENNENTFPGKTDSGIEFSVFILYLVFVFLNPQNIFPAIRPLRLALIISTIAFIICLLKNQGEIRIFYNAQSKLLFLFLCLSGIAVLNALDTQLSFTYWISYVKLIFLYLVIILLIRNKSDLFTIIWAMIILLSVNAIFSFIQFKKGVMGYRMISFDQEGGANDYALMLLCILPFGLFFLEYGKTKLQKGFSGIAVFIFLTCLTRTRSRMGFLGLLFLMFQYFIVKRKRLGMVFVLAGALTFTLMHTHSGYFERVSTTTDADEARDSRIELWEQAWKLMKIHPFSGVGPGNFVIAKNHYGVVEAGGDTVHVAHSGFFEVGAEVGVPGLILYILVMLISLKKLKSARKKLKENEKDLFGFCLSLRMAYLTLAFSMLFLSQQYISFYFIFAGISAALENMALKYERNSN